MYTVSNFACLSGYKILISFFFSILPCRPIHCSQLSSFLFLLQLPAYTKFEVFLFFQVNTIPQFLRWTFFINSFHVAIQGKLFASLYIVAYVYTLSLHSPSKIFTYFISCFSVSCESSSKQKSTCIRTCTSRMFDRTA